MCRATSSSSAAPPAVLSHSQSPSGVVTDTTVRVVVGPVLCQPQALHPQTVLLPSGGQACRFCPSNPHRLAVAASQLFGICGEGQLLVVDFGNNTTPQRAAVRTTGRIADVPHGRQGKSVPFRLGETQAHWASLPFVPSDVQNGAALAALESIEAAARRDEALTDAAAERPSPNVRTTAVLTTRDAIHDCAWSSKQANILAAACGDGAVRVWNIPLESPLQFYAHGSFAYTTAGRSAATQSAGLHVAAEITAHQAEVCTVDWSPRHPQVLLSASWDATARLWDLLRPSQHVLRCLRHPQCVYAAQFSPHLAAVIASVSADGRLRIFDLHMPPRKVSHLHGLVTPAASSLEV